MEEGWRTWTWKDDFLLGGPAMVFSSLCVERGFILFVENMISLGQIPKSEKKTHKE